MKRRGTSRILWLTLFSVSLLALLLHPPPAGAQEAVTKGAFVEKFFLSRFSRPPAARAYVPAGAESLPPAERYAAVVKGLSGKGVMILTGTKPDGPLTRVEFITLTYLLAGGRPEASFAEQKNFLKAKGVLDAQDIGVIKAFQGDATVTRAGQEQGRKITGAEPVMFRDLDETELGARVELQFDDGSTLTIGEDTALAIDEMVYDPKTTRRSIRLRVTVGTIRVNAAKNAHPDSRFEVVTPSLVAGVRGTVFVLKVDQQGRTELLNIEGSLGARQVGESPQAEVRVEQGQKTAAAAGGAVGPVETASQEEVQQATQATTVTQPATVAAVSAAATSQTNAVVAVAIKQPAEGAVTSKQDITKQVSQKPTEEDKGESSDEVTTTGSVGDGKLTTGTTPAPTPSTPEEQVKGKGGADLKTAFLGFSDAVQAELFGKLTSEQQNELVSLLSQTEAEALLARFKPASPFTAAVLKSLLDFGAAASGVNIAVTADGISGTLNRFGQLFDNVTTLQAVEFERCNEAVRTCVGEGQFDWFKPGSDDDLSDHGAAVATGISREVARLARALSGTLTEPQDDDPLPVNMMFATATFDDIIKANPTQNSAQDLSFFMGEEILLGIDELPDGFLATDQAVVDIFGGGFISKPTANGGYQAGQLRSTAGGARGGSSALIDVSARAAAANSNGFLAYAVQVEEDLVNAAALIVKDVTASAPGTAVFVSGRIESLIDDALDLSDIRTRDARLQAEADARAGVVLFDSSGDRVRVQQYVYRNSKNTNEVRMVSISLREPDNVSGTPGLHYISLGVEFQSANGISGKSAIEIRDLPWNSYFTVLFNGDASSCQSSQMCEPLIGSPSGSPAVLNMRMEMGNPRGDFIIEEMLGFGSQVCCENLFNYAGEQVKSSADSIFHQHPTLLQLTTKKATDSTVKEFKVGDGSSVVQYDPRAGSTLSTNSIPAGQYRVRPIRFGPQNVIDAQDQNNPAGFNYLAVPPGGGATQFFGVRFAVVGDATTQASAGRQTSTCGTGGTSSCGFNSIRFDNIWDAFRVNLPDDSTSNPQGLPPINIGANSLEIRVPGTLTIAGQSPFVTDIRNVFIPFPRMIWKGESGF